LDSEYFGLFDCSYGVQTLGPGHFGPNPNPNPSDCKVTFTVFLQTFSKLPDSLIAGVYV